LNLKDCCPSIHVPKVLSLLTVVKVKSRETSMLQLINYSREESYIVDRKEVSYFVNMIEDILQVDFIM
jgi:hypothetical protein